LDTINKLRLVTGNQLERLYFADLVGRSREVTRGRVLRRLVAWRVLVVLPRRVGGAVRGSARSVFALDAAGVRLLTERDHAHAVPRRVRRPGAPGDRTVRHTLALSELYVSLLTYTANNDTYTLAAFDAEPAAWWPNGLGGWLKPDAYLRLCTPQYDDHWWVEADLATEGLPTIQRKLTTYLDFYQRGQLGPGGVVPRVLVSTVTAERRDAIRSLVAHLPPPADALFVVTVDRDAALDLVGTLKA
jgi:hypothetical protein